MNSSLTRRDFLRVSGTALVGAGALLTVGCGEEGGNGSLNLVFWDNLFELTDRPKSQWFITKAIEKFENKYPDIEVDRVSQSPDITTYYNQFRAAGMSKQGPDVATLFAGGPAQSFSDFLEPLDQYFNSEEISQLSGWEAVRKNFSPNGEIIAAPYGAGSYFEVMYNKELFGKAGIDNVTPPKTWEDFLQFAQEIKATGATPVVIGEQEGYAGAWIMATLVGGQIGTDGFFKMRRRELPINDQSMITGYENYRKLYELGLTNEDAGSKTNEQGQQMFIQGEGTMLIQGGWFNQPVVDAMGDNVGNFPIPTLAGAPHAGGIAGGPNVALGVTNYSEYKEEAVKFIKFLLQPEIIDMYVNIHGTEPSNNKNADLNAIDNPLLKSQAEWLKAGNTIYPFDNIMPQDINDLFYRMNATVFTGKTSPEAAVDRLQQEYSASA
jgi:raffinose/stachyose/melibiose transport system substrate-binding protein